MDTPQELLSLLRVNAVLLPIKKETKQPTRRGWQKIEYSETLKPTYQTSLTNAAAIGVSLGTPSGNLCSIDFDDQSALDEFLDLNPRLSGTLRTTAKRGANLWIVLNDSPPTTRKLKRNGEPIGEWRSTGSHTIITGQHPEGFAYRRAVDLPPLRLAYSEIVWPKEWATSPPYHLSQLSQSSPIFQSSQSSPSLNPLHDIRGKIEASEKARDDLNSNESLKRLYCQFVEKRFTPRQGARNSDLIDLITFNFRAVGYNQLLALARAFYEVNQDVFTDPLDQHMREAQSHQATCERKWHADLLPVERAIVATLPPRQLEAFRICRDLSLLDAHESPVGFFYLSCPNLGDRLALDVKQAHRILQQFRSSGIIEATEEGIRHAKGIRGKATRYRWNLP